MQIAALLALVAFAATVHPAPQDFWGNQPFPEYYGDSQDVPQWGWFKNGLEADAGADADDTYTNREYAHLSGWVQDRLSEAAAFLSDQYYDTFDFQEWYHEQLEDFKLDQEDVDYDNDYDKRQDMDDFKDQLDQIAYDFAQAQGRDYSDYVADVMSHAWDKAADEATELIKRIRETGRELNELDHQAAEVYHELIQIGCGDPTSDNSYLGIYDPLGEGESLEDRHTRLLALVDVSDAADEFPEFDDLSDFLSTRYDSVTYFGIDEEYLVPQCKLSQIFFEIVEINSDLYEPESYEPKKISRKRRHKLENRKDRLVRKFNKLRREWRKLRRQLDDLTEKGDHERTELKQLNKLLAGIFSEDEEDGLLGGTPLFDGSRAARGTKLNGDWDIHGNKPEFRWDELYENEWA